MDDGYAIHEDIDYLYLCLECADLICQEIGLELNRKKTVVVPLEDFYRWLKTKFILTPTGKVVLKMNKESTKIIRRKLRSFKGKYENGDMTLKDIRSSLDSYHGHMKRGNSYKVCQSTDHYFKSLFGFYPDKKVGTLMYKIMKENTALAVVTTPVWVKMQDNGSFALCEEAEAQGVVVDGTVYHVSGRPEIEGHETVILGEITETAYQRGTGRRAGSQAAPNGHGSCRAVHSDRQRNSGG